MDYSEFSKKLFSSGTTKRIIFKVINIQMLSLESTKKLRETIDAKFLAYKATLIMPICVRQ